LTAAAAFGMSGCAGATVGVAGVGAGDCDAVAGMAINNAAAQIAAPKAFNRF
jgi:hypothetical protein